MMQRILLVLICLLLSLSSFSWNGNGHKLVAQIAYDNLTPAAKQRCNQYNQALNKFYPGGNFVTAATWLDQIRQNDVHWFDMLHYKSIPFSKDGTPLPEVAEQNAFVGINNALEILNSPKTSIVDKGLSLRILVHIVGDIHQPLHTISQVTKEHPKGDMGGNLFFLGRNNIGSNLHQYWDNGGGVLIGQSRDLQIKNKARQLEKKWSCTIALKRSNPKQWIKQSHQLALTQAYTLRPGTVPSKRYQLKTQNLAQKQIFVAGCRLAALLNATAKY